MGWVYVFGEVSGEDVKFGYTSAAQAAIRLKEVNRDQTTNAEYVVLAAVRGDKKDESACLKYFADDIRSDKGRRHEYLWPTDEVVSYANWLRSQWFVSADGLDDKDAFEHVDPSHWLPNEQRVRSRPADDVETLIQEYELRDDHLSGTAWSWMVNPQASIQDYFTPPDLIQAARTAMGGIDLDAASHWLANREHQIPDYFDVNRSAFDNAWYGKVWLNPPYGDNSPWWEEVVRWVSDGSVTQICILSPIWAFNTQIAEPVIDLASALVVLSPTPLFWGNANNKTGTNQPHGILYIGARHREFLKAFLGRGIPMRIVGEDGWKEPDE